MPYQHLLVAIDLTDDSHTVIEHASALAKLCKAKLSLVHVVEPISTGIAAEISVDEKTLHQERLDQSREEVEALCARHPQVSKENCQLTFGQARHEVHRLAKELGCDLIVTGSHGRHGLALLLGSTPNALLHDAPCDLLAVRLSEEQE